MGRPKLTLSQDIYPEDMVMVDIEELVDMDIMAMERGLLRPKLMLNQDISPEDIEELVDMDITAMERDLLRLKLNQVIFQEDMVLEGTEVMDWDMEDITAMVDLEDIMVNFLEAKVSAEKNVFYLNKKIGTLKK